MSEILPALLFALGAPIATVGLVFAGVYLKTSGKWYLVWCLVGCIGMLATVFGAMELGRRMVPGA